MTPDRHPRGTPRREADGWVVRFERQLTHERQKVWRAITESEHLRHWMPCDIVGARRQGAAIELQFWPPHVERYGIETPTLHGRIRVWDRRRSSSGPGRPTSCAGSWRTPTAGRG